MILVAHGRSPAWFVKCFDYYHNNYDYEHKLLLCTMSSSTIAAKIPLIHRDIESIHTWHTCRKGPYIGVLESSVSCRFYIPHHKAISVEDIGLALEGGIWLQREEKLTSAHNWKNIWIGTLVSHSWFLTKPFAWFVSSRQFEVCFIWDHVEA